MHEYRRLQLEQAAAATVPLNEAGELNMTTDLDAFLAGVYRYYVERGLVSVMSRSITNWLASILTFILAVVVLLLVDWASVLACTSEETCGDLFFYNPIYPLSLYRFFILVQLVPMGLYTVILSSLSCVAKVREAIRVARFYKDSLFIAEDDELHFISWPDIVARIVRHQSTSTTPLCIVQDTLSALEIQNILMRTENLTLSINKRWMDLLKNEKEWKYKFILSLLLQSKAMQWCLQHGLVAWLFDDRYRLRRDVLDSPFQVASRIRLIGVVSLALMGPLAIFALILLFILEADDVRSRRYSLFESEWTPLAKVVLGHFCETRESLSDRLRQGKEFGEEFSSSIIKNKAAESGLRFVKFSSAGFLAVLALIAVVQDAALLHMTLGGKSLLFLFAIFSGIVAICSGLNTTTPVKVGDKLRSGLGLIGSIHTDLSSPGTSLRSHSAGPTQESLTHARELDLISLDFGRMYFCPKFFSLACEILGIVLLPLFFIHVLPTRLSEVVTECRIVASESLGDFAAEGFMSGGIGPGQSEEMTTAVSGQVAFSSLRSVDRVSTLIMMVSEYGPSCGVTKDQIALFNLIETFMKRCNSKIDEVPKNRNMFFWYLVMRELTMSTGDCCLIRMVPGLLAVGMEALGSVAMAGA